MQTARTKAVDSSLDAQESCEQTLQVEKGEMQLGEVCGELEFQTSLPLPRNAGAEELPA